VNTNKCTDDGDTHKDVMDCVSWRIRLIFIFDHMYIGIKLTPANRQISVPVATFVSNASSATQVKSFVPSAVTATGPDV